MHGRIKNGSDRHMKVYSNNLRRTKLQCLKLFSHGVKSSKKQSVKPIFIRGKAYLVTFAFLVEQNALIFLK